MRSGGSSPKLQALVATLRQHFSVRRAGAGQAGNRGVQAQGWLDGHACAPGAPPPSPLTSLPSTACAGAGRGRHGPRHRVHQLEGRGDGHLRGSVRTRAAHHREVRAAGRLVASGRQQGRPAGGALAGLASMRALTRLHDAQRGVPGSPQGIHRPGHGQQERGGHEPEGAERGPGWVQVRRGGAEMAVALQGSRRRCVPRVARAPSTHLPAAFRPCRAGSFNCLVATCIGEEGLDIPQVPCSAALAGCPPAPSLALAHGLHATCYLHQRSCTPYLCPLPAPAPVPPKCAGGPHCVLRRHLLAHPLHPAHGPHGATQGGAGGLPAGGGA